MGLSNEQKAVRHRIDGLEIPLAYRHQNIPVRHRIDGLETQQSTT